MLEMQWNVSFGLLAINNGWFFSLNNFVEIYLDLSDFYCNFNHLTPVSYDRLIYKTRIWTRRLYLFSCLEIHVIRGTLLIFLFLCAMIIQKAFIRVLGNGQRIVHARLGTSKYYQFVACILENDDWSWTPLLHTILFGICLWLCYDPPSALAFEKYFEPSHYFSWVAMWYAKGSWGKLKCCSSAFSCNCLFLCYLI